MSTATTDLKSIRTRYKGILFRSKLEADWAITLDTLGFKWEYEPEGRYWGKTFYAPDFYLPDTDQWVEVKGVMSDQAADKHTALVTHYERKARTPNGGSPIHGPVLILATPKGYFQGLTKSHLLGEMPYWPTSLFRCPKCGVHRFIFDTYGLWPERPHVRARHGCDPDAPLFDRVALSDITPFPLRELA